VAAQLTSSGSDELWIKTYIALDSKMKDDGSLKVYYALAKLNLSRFDEAKKIINEDFVMSDIKEGELSVSHIWFELYRRIYAKENGITYDGNDKELINKADEKYPLPKSLDFRMHDM